MADMTWFKDGTADFADIAITTNGIAQPLTGATCTLECELFSGGSLPLTITDESGGIVRAKPTLSQLNAATIGVTKARVRVALASGDVAYFPKQRFLSVAIEASP